MTENNKDQSQKIELKDKEVANEASLEEVFSTLKGSKNVEEAKEEKEVKKENKKSYKDDAPEKEDSDNNDDTKDEDSIENDVEDDVIDRDTELERLKKSFKDTQSWGHNLSRESKELSKKLKAAEEKILEYVENGNLTEGEADEIFRHTTHNEPEHAEPVLMPQQEVSKILDEEYSKMRKYSDDPELDNYAQAFIHLTNTCSAEESRDILSKLEKVKKDPVLMTKNALNMGKKYYNDFYKEFTEAGDIYKLRNRYKERLSDQKKTIDNLKKEIVKLQENSDYIPSESYSISTGSTAKTKVNRSYSVDNILGRAKAGVL